WRKIGRVRPRPGRSQTVDDLKQQRRCSGSAAKGGIRATVEISHPNSENVMIKDRDRPRIAKSVRCSGLPINGRAVTPIRAIHLRSRNVPKHFQSEKRSLRRKDSVALRNRIIRSVSKRSQLAVIRKRRVEPNQILHRHFGAAERKRESVK